MTSHASPPPALPAHLKIGIVLFPNAFPLDFIGPLDILNTLLPSKNTADPLGVSITPVLLSHSLDPLPTSGGWSIVPHMTFTQAIEGETRGGWDGILVPGGQGARPWAEENIPAQEFIKAVVDQCKVVMTGKSCCHLSVLCPKRYLGRVHLCHEKHTGKVETRRDR